MSSSESGAFEIYADRIRRNDKSLTEFGIYDWGILCALKDNSVVKKVSIVCRRLPDTPEALAKLSELMKCNKSVESLTVCLQRGLLGERAQILAVMATSGGWSSIQELVLDDNFEPLSLRESQHLSNFII